MTTYACLAAQIVQDHQVRGISQWNITLPNKQAKTEDSISEQDRMEILTNYLPSLSEYFGWLAVLAWPPRPLTGDLPRLFLYLSCLESRIALVYWF